MKKLLIRSGLIILAFTTILLVIPYVISLEEYKGIIQEEVKKATGIELTIKKKLKLGFLPRPRIIANNIELSNPENKGTYPMLQLEKGEIILAILPLLKEKIVIADIVMERPRVYLAKQAEQKQFLVKKGLEDEHIKRKFEGFKLPFTIRNITAKQGQLIYAEDNKEVAFNDINFVIKNLFGQGPTEFVLNSKILEENFTGNGVIDTTAIIMPLRAEIQIKEVKANLEGNFNLDNLSFEGKLKLEGNGKNLTNFFPAIPIALQESYALETSIMATKEVLDFKNLHFSIGKITAQGSGSYSLKENTPYLGLEIRPGEINIEIIKTSVPENYKVTLKARSPKSLIEKLAVDLPVNREVYLNNPLLLEALICRRPETLEIRNISMVFGEADLRGDITAQWVKELKLLYNLESRKGSVLGSFFGIDLPVRLSNVKIKGETSKNNQLIETNTYITLADMVTQVAGKIQLEKSYKPTLTITASGESLNNTLKQLFNQKSPSLVLGSFNLSTIFTGQMPAFEVVLTKYDMVVNNKKISLNGKAQVDLKVKPKITLDLVTSTLDLRSQGAIDSKTHADDNTQQRGFAWSREKIDISFLNAFDALCTINIPKLISPPFEIDTLKTRLKLENGTVTIETLKGNIYGGSIDISGHLVEKTGEVSLKSRLNQAQLKDLVPGYKAIKIAGGVFDLNASLESRGKSDYDYAKNVSGNISFTGTNGRLSGINLQKVLDTLTNIKDPSNIIENLQASFLGGETIFNNLKGNIVIKEGQGQITNFKLEADQITATGEGEINLPAYQLDIASKIKVNVKNLPPFDVRVYGPIDNMRREVDVRALISYVTENILTNAIDKMGGKSAPKEMLKSIIKGGKKQPDNSVDMEERSEGVEKNQKDPLQQETEKLIKKGLKNIFSK